MKQSFIFLFLFLITVIPFHANADLLNSAVRIKALIRTALLSKSALA